MGENDLGGGKRETERKGKEEKKGKRDFSKAMKTTHCRLNAQKWK